MELGVLMVLTYKKTRNSVLYPLPIKHFLAGSILHIPCINCCIRILIYYIICYWKALYHKKPSVILSKKAILSMNIINSLLIQHFTPFNFCHDKTGKNVLIMIKVLLRLSSSLLFQTEVFFYFFFFGGRGGATFKPSHYTKPYI